MANDLQNQFEIVGYYSLLQQHVEYACFIGERFKDKSLLPGKKPIPNLCQDSPRNYTVQERTQSILNLIPDISGDNMQHKNMK